MDDKKRAGNPYSITVWIPEDGHIDKDDIMQQVSKLLDDLINESGYTLPLGDKE